MLIFMYQSRKELKESIGQPLKFRETSIFELEYHNNGKLIGSNRPYVTGIKDREFFAKVTMNEGKIQSVK